MIIDYDNMPETVDHEFKGGNGDFINKKHVDDNNKIIRGKLQPGSSIGYHKHENNSEIIYILSGNGEFVYDDVKESVSEGYVHYCPEGHSHSLTNTGTKDLCFFAVVPEHSK